MCGIAGILSSDIDLRGEKLLVEKWAKRLTKEVLIQQVYI